MTKNNNSMRFLLFATVASAILSNSPTIATSTLHHDFPNERRIAENDTGAYRFNTATIGVDFDDGNKVLPLKVRRADPPALLPSAKFSIYGRESRFVGELGSSLIVADNRDSSSDAAEENFVLLAVNHQKRLVTGIVGVPGEPMLTVTSGDMIEVLEGGDAEADEFRRLKRIRAKTSSHVQLQLGENDVWNFGNGMRKAASLPTPTAAMDALPKVINLYLEIDRAIIENNGMTLCNTFEYVNSLVTASNSILEPQLGVVVNVPFVNQAGTGVRDLEYYDGANLHYSLSGSSSEEEQEQEEDGSEVPISCGQVDSFGTLSGMKGSFESLNEDFFYDVEKFVKAIGRSVASAPENISCLSTSVANPPTEDMIYGDEQCVSPKLPRGNPAPMPSQASDFSYDVFRIQSPTNTMEAMDFNHLKETRGGSKASKDIEPDDPLAGSPSTASSVKSAKTKKSDDVGIAPDAKTGKSKKRPRVPPPSTSPSSSPSYSLVPSKSAAPSDAPSVSTSPSTSAVPTNIPTYSPTFTPTYNPT